MRLLLTGLSLVLVACTPFGGATNESGPANENGPANAGADASAALEAGASSGNVVNGSRDGGVEGGATSPFQTCAKPPVVRTVDFEGTTAEWDDHGIITRSNDAARQSRVGHFLVSSDIIVSDRSTLALTSPIEGRPTWARVEWDATTLKADPYTCFGCTLGPMERYGTGLEERGRAYLATQLSDLGEANGVYPTLDPWWMVPKQLFRSSAPMSLYQPSWHHYALEMIFHHDAASPTLTLRAYVDGALDGALTDKPWSPNVDAITSRCGALYMDPKSGTATTQLDMDNITLTVCLP